MTMKRTDFPIVGSLHEDIVTKINAERTINMYEVEFPQGKKPSYLHPTPGKLEIAPFSDGNAGRASFVFGIAPNIFTYFVVGATIYRMDTSLVPVVLAASFFTTTTGYVAISANQFEVIFMDGIKTYLFNTTTNVGTDITASFPTGFVPFDVDFMDGYFIVISKSTGQENKFYLSNLNDGATWSTLDFALINSRPTVLNGVAVLKRRIFFFGLTKSEVWQDAGFADFPFRRDNNLLLEHGVSAINSIDEGFELLFYLSGDADGVGSIMMVYGTSPEPISTPQMDEKIQMFTNPSDAIGFVYKINGQIFYQISFQADDHTFVYNVNTKKWHEQQVLNGTRDTSVTHAFFDNKHFITTYNDSKLYQLSYAFLSNNGEKIKRTRICRTMSSPTYERIKHSRMQIDMLKGVGLINTKGLNHFGPLAPPPPSASDVNPEVFLSVSQDGGITYMAMGTADFGAAGDRLIRIIWRQLGTYRDAIFKFEIFNAVPVYILGGAIDYEVQPQ